MTIKEELRKQLQQAKAKQTEVERNLEAEARVMIEELVIPKFRECAKAFPLSPLLAIRFHNNIGCWCYTSNVDDWEYRKQPPYDYKVVDKAVEIAKDYDIEAEVIDDGAGGTIHNFTLTLL